MDSRWDIPRKRALFTSDGTDSTTFGSNTPESHAHRAPDVEYSERLITDKRQGEGGTKRPYSSHIQLEMAVSQLQRDLPRRTGAGEKPDSGSHPPISEVVEVHIDAGSEILREVKLEQYREVFEAIVCSNGWDDVTAALQLLSHLDGDALNIALQCPGAFGRIQASVSAGSPASGI